MRAFNIVEYTFKHFFCGDDNDVRYAYVYFIHINTTLAPSYLLCTVMPCKTVLLLPAELNKNFC